MIDESYRRKEANINDSFKFRRRYLYRRNASPPRPSARGGKGADARLSEVLSYALDGYAYETATEISAFEDYVKPMEAPGDDTESKNPVQGRILFAVPLGTSGINLELYCLIRFLREHPDFLNGFVGDFWWTVKMTSIPNQRRRIWYLPLIVRAARSWDARSSRARGHFPIRSFPIILEPI